MSPDGPKENLVKEISNKENAIQDAKLKTNPDDIAEASRDVVDEKQVEQHFNKIEEKLKSSPLSEKYKKQIESSLAKESDKWKSDIAKIDNTSEEKFKELFSKVIDELEAFNEQPEVKEIYDVIEPFFKDPATVKKAINLKTYGRKSGDWQRINDKLGELGDKDFVEKLQKILKIEEDGKVGPQTANALSQMLGLGIEVKFGKKTVYATDPVPPPQPAPAETPAPSPSQEEPVDDTQDDEVVTSKVPARFAPPTTKPSGIGQLERKSEEEKVLDNMTAQEKMQLLKDYTKSLEKLELSDAQKLRLAQIDMVKTILETIKSEIKNRRTWSEKASQFADALHDTWLSNNGNSANKEVNGLSDQVELTDKITKLIIQNPNMTVDEAMDQVGSQAKEIMAKYDLQKGKGAYGGNHSALSTGLAAGIGELPFARELGLTGGKLPKDLRNGNIGTILDPETLKFKEAKDMDELNEQYLTLIEFMRERKDYAGVTVLVEDNLLKDYFTRERAKLEVKQKEEIRKEALRKTVAILSGAYKTWDEKKIPKEAQYAWAQSIEQEQLMRAKLLYYESWRQEF